MEPSRVFAVETLDVKSIRAKFGVSQNEFASLLGISVRTLENRKQKRRIPKDPARVLLEVAAAHPDAVWMRFGVQEERLKENPKILEWK